MSSEHHDSSNRSEQDLTQNAVNSQQPGNNDPDFVALGSTETEQPVQDAVALQARISQLEAEVTDIKARSNADMYNFQKRMERENDNAKKYALEKFASQLLEVVDNLERALHAAGDEINPVLEGVRLTHKSLLTVLEKHGVTVIDPQGIAFNADQHEAVGVDPNTPAGQVASVLQKGYSLSGRLLRPAMVTVGQ